MARLHTIGHIGDPATFGKCEAATVGTGQLRESTTVRPGDKYSLKISSLASGVRQGIQNRPVSATTDGVPYYWQTSLYVVTRPSAANEIIGFANSSTMTPSGDLNVRLLSTGELELRDNTTVLFTSSVIALTTWTVIDIQFKRHATTPNAGSDTLEMRIDGAVVFTSTTASTVALSGQIIGGNLLAEAQTQGEWYFGRMAVNDNTGSSDASYPSITERVSYLHPDGTGTHDEPTATGASPNWECVNENSPNGLTDYASMTANSANWSSAGSRLMMTCTSAASAGIGAKDTINHVTIGVVWQAASAAACTVQPGLRSGGSTIDVGTGKSINVTTDSFLDDAVPAYAAQPLDPAGAAWTATALDALEIGARGSDTTPNCQVTAVWALVAFEPRPATDTAFPDARQGRATPTFTPPNLLTSTLGAVGLPCGAIEVTVPRRGTAGFPGTVVSTRPQEDFAQAFAQLDWTLPPVPRRPTLTWTNAPPPSTAVPFVPIDWSMPARRRIEDTSFVSALIVEAAPFTPIEWPVPPRRHALGAPAALNRLVLSVSGDKPFLQTEWPTSRRRLEAALSQPSALSVLTSTPPAAAPFLPLAWTLPSVTFRRDVGFVRGSTLELDAIIPFLPTQWAPADPIRRVAAEIPANLIALRTAIVAAPFAQLDWPVPVWRRPRPGEQLPAVVATLAGAPLRPLEWIVAPWRRTPTATLAIGHNGILNYFAGLKPFARDDWRLPPFVPVHPRLRTWLQEKPSYYVQPTLGITRPDWPVPGARRAFNRVALSITGGAEPSFPPLLATGIVGHNNLQPYITVYFWRRVG